MGNWMDSVVFCVFPKTVPDQSLLCLVMEDAESLTSLLVIKLNETLSMVYDLVYGVVFGWCNRANETRDVLIHMQSFLLFHAGANRVQTAR